MAIRVQIPIQLRTYTKKRESLQVDGQTVGELLQELINLYPPLRKKLFNEMGQLCSLILVNNEDIRNIENESTPVTHHDRVTILPRVVSGN